MSITGATRERDERQARGEPPDGSHARAHLRDRDQHGVADEWTDRREHGDQGDRERRSAEARIDGAECPIDESPAPQRVHEPCCRDEVAVENLEQRKQGARQHQSNDPRSPERAGEGRICAEVLCDQIGPRIHPRRDTHDQHVEQASRNHGERDHAAQQPGIEARPRFLRGLRNRLEPRHEVGNNLQDEQHGDDRARRGEERFEIGGGAAGKPENREYDKTGEQTECSDVLEAATRANAAIVDEANDRRESEPGN